jgi:hypothetical protein
VEPSTTPPTCSDASAAADESLAGTTTQAVSWLAIECRGAWGRDAVVENELAADAVAAASAFAGRVVMIRRPDGRDPGTVVFRAETTDAGGTLVRHELADLVDADDPAELPNGASMTGPLVLVCAHGRRDACCARLGRPVFEALADHVDSKCLWQSSHQGGHRFAANVLVLPAGVQLGRVAPQDAPRVAALLREGRIPLDHYRGRAAYPSRVQAAEVAVRRHLGIDAVDGVAPAGVGDDAVTFTHADGEITVYVEERPGPDLPLSCGAEPDATVRYVVAF